MANPLPNEDKLYEQIIKEGITINPELWDLLYQRIGDDLSAINLLCQYYLTQDQPIPLVEMQKILNYTRHIKVMVRDITLTSKKDFPFPEFSQGIPLHPILREMLTHYIGNDVYAINLIVGYYMDIKEPIPLQDILKILKHTRAIKEFMERLKDATLKDKSNNLASLSKEKDSKVLSKKEIFLKIRALLAKEFNLNEEKIKLESRFKEDLGLDSVDAIELIMVVEEAFDFEMPDEDIEKINSVSELVDYISFKVYKKRA